MLTLMKYCGKCLIICNCNLGIWGMQNKLLGTILWRYELHTVVRFALSWHLLYGCLTPLCCLAFLLVRGNEIRSKCKWHIWTLSIVPGSSSFRATFLTEEGSWRDWIIFLEALTFVFSKIICLNVGDGSRLERVQFC